MVHQVDSALITLDFTRPQSEVARVKGEHLRMVLSASFHQRRKMMRQSLKQLLTTHSIELPERWATRRPEELYPLEFVELTAELFGETSEEERRKAPSPVWRSSTSKGGRTVTPE